MPCKRKAPDNLDARARLADCDAEAAGAVRVLSQYFPPGLCSVAGARVDVSPIARAIGNFSVNVKVSGCNPFLVNAH